MVTEKRALSWPTILFIFGYHIALLGYLPFYFMNHSPSKGIWITTVTLFALCNLSITCGYHRLYSHSAYKANKVVEAIILFFATLATQSSALKWSFDHRHHHAFVDTDRDPYSIKKGFLYAHIWWMFRKGLPIDKKVVADLLKNRMLYWQNRFYPYLMFAANILTTLVIGYMLNDYLGALVMTWGVRLFFSHHTTWFINSLAHTWGKQSYSQEHTAMDNHILSLLTFGEGFHNYHHTFANDYRNGVRWFDFDPSKWVIWTLSKLGLAYQLKKADDARIHKHLLDEQRLEILERVKEHFSSQLQPIEAKLDKISQNLLEKYRSFQKLQLQYKEFKSKNADRSALNQVRQEIAAVKGLIKAEYKAWKSFYKQIMLYKPSETIQLT